MRVEEALIVVVVFFDVPVPIAVIDQKRLTPRTYSHHFEIDCREMATIESVATRDCEFFPVLCFSCLVLRKVSLISTFVIALGVVFC